MRCAVLSRVCMVPMLLLVTLILFMAVGCAGGEVRTSRPGMSDSLSVGAVDEAFRRASTGDQADSSIFRPIDWPTPTEVRLASGAPGPDYWQQQSDYTISAHLDPKLGRIEASVQVVYHNNSPHTLDYLWLNLEQNLFRTDSLGSKSRSPGSVMKMLEDDFDGGYSFSSIRTGSNQTGGVAGGQSLDMKVYDTLGRIDLPSSIAPGTQFVFEMEYAFDIPPHLRRMGSEEVEQGTIFEIAQWIPQVCKYDDVHGWNTMPYLGSGEFYTDFGNFDVAITVPRDYLVSGSGALINPTEVLTQDQQSQLAQAMQSDEPVWIVDPMQVGQPDIRPGNQSEFTWKFHIDSARTFAWAASDAFIWDACRAQITDANGMDTTVLCQSFYPSEATAWYNIHEKGGSSRAIKHSIEFYSDFLFPYPYPVMSNINGPEGGMEYPGIIFCGSRTNPDGMFNVTDHEIGHNWFPMVINNDERRFKWQDEGVNTFINLYSKAAWYKRDTDISRAMSQTMSLAMAEHQQSIMTYADQVWPRWTGRLMYRKPAHGLYLLREFILGPDRFDAAFDGYTSKWLFKHPQPEDFFRSMEDGSGMELGWFWRGWFLEPTTLDQAIVGVKNLEDSAIVVLDNLGDMVMPVRMRVEYKDGSSEVVDLPVEIWFQTDRWRAGLDTNGRTIKQITLDPDSILPDTDRTNNTWR